MATVYSTQSPHFTESGSSPPSPDREPDDARRDIRLSDLGCIVLLHPVTRAAARWFDSHITEDTPRLGRALVCEPWYGDDFVVGARAAGLTVEVESW